MQVFFIGHGNTEYGMNAFGKAGERNSYFRNGVPVYGLEQLFNLKFIRRYFRYKDNNLVLKRLWSDEDRYLLILTGNHSSYNLTLASCYGKDAVEILKPLEPMYPPRVSKPFNKGQFHIWAEGVQIEGVADIQMPQLRRFQDYINRAPFPGSYGTR